MTSTLASSLSSARTRASGAVEEAQSFLGSLKDRVRDKFETGASLAVRHAVALDARLHVGARAVAVSNALKVPERAAKAQEYASAVEERFQLRNRITASLDKAASVDAAVTGGRGT
eukprot:375165_1